MKKVINSLRINEALLSNMEQAHKKLESMNLTPLTFQEFRRLAYEFFSNLVLGESEDKIRKLLQK